MDKYRLSWQNCIPIFMFIYYYISKKKNIIVTFNIFDKKLNLCV